MSERKCPHCLWPIPRPPRLWQDAPAILTFEEAAMILRWTEEALEKRLNDEELNERNPLPYIAWEGETTFPSDKLREWANREAEL